MAKAQTTCRNTGREEKYRARPTSLSVYVYAAPVLERDELSNSSKNFRHRAVGASKHGHTGTRAHGRVRAVSTPPAYCGLGGKLGGKMRWSARKKKKRERASVVCTVCAGNIIQEVRTPQHRWRAVHAGIESARPPAHRKSPKRLPPQRLDMPRYCHSCSRAQWRDCNTAQCAACGGQ